MSRVIPINDKKEKSIYEETLSGIKDLTENTQKKIVSMLDFDKDGEITAGDFYKRYNKSIKTLRFLYDVSIDNLPLGSMIGLFTTASASTLILLGIRNTKTILNNYFEKAEVTDFELYFELGVACYLLLHGCILLHGISICSLETSRELCGKNEVGCFCCCKDPNTNMGKICRICQKYSRITSQLTLGIIGTLLMILFYGISLALFVISIICIQIAWYARTSCNTFAHIVEDAKNQSMGYIDLARDYINSADKAALLVLSQYNTWVDLQQKLLDTGLSEIDNTKNSIISYPNKDLLSSDSSKNTLNELGRHLSANSDFDPLVSISEGRTVLSTLNTSIAETEKQLAYYSKYLDFAKKACFDYASLYDEIYIICLGVTLLLISHFFMFAVHWKYFSVWNYEVKLTNAQYKE